MNASSLHSLLTEDSADFRCERNLILVNSTFQNDSDSLHSMQLLVSFKMSLCMLLFMYVLYSLCRIAFNYKTRDALTTSIQILFCVSLFFRSLQIASNLISKDDDASIHQSYILYVVFFYIADFLFESAIILQMCLWLDISVLINYQKPGRFQNQDTQKSKFNEFERMRTLMILGLSETLLLIVNISIATLQVGHCNQMT